MPASVAADNINDIPTPIVIIEAPHENSGRMLQAMNAINLVVKGPIFPFVLLHQRKSKCLVRDENFRR